MVRSVIQEGLNTLSGPVRQRLALTGIVIAGIAGISDIAGTPPLAEAATTGTSSLNQPVLKTKTMSQEPGYGLDIKLRNRRELEASAVEIGTYNSGSIFSTAGPYPEVCDGLKLSVPHTNVKYIDTAGHCPSPLTDSKYGAFYDPAAPHTKAENYFSISNTWNYAVLNKQALPPNNINHPIAYVNGIAIDTTGVDIAWLKTTPPNKKQQMTSPYGKLTYSKIPAIPMTQLVTKDTKLVPGEQIELDSTPRTNGYLPMSTTGRYVGRYNTATTLGDTQEIGKRLLDWVAIKAVSPNTDACQDGSSGGSAATATGRFLGPLSFRLSLGYGPEGQRTYNPLSDNAAFDQLAVSQLEVESGINLSPYNTICGFTVPPKNIGYTMLRGLRIMHRYNLSSKQ